MALEFGDYVPDDAAFKIRRGTGTKQRHLNLTEGASATQQAWRLVRGNAPGHVFPPLIYKRGGRISGNAITLQVVYNMLHMQAQATEMRDGSAYAFRRTCAGDLLEEAVAIATVQHLLGHAHMQTMVRYDRRRKSAKWKALGTLHVAYVRKEHT